VEQGRGKLMTRRTLRMLALIVVAVLVACVVALLTVSEKAEAFFPGKYGKMAYARASDGAIRYSLLEPGGGAKTEVVGGHKPSFSPDGGASARGASSGTERGFKPGGGAGPAYRASEKLQLTKKKAGARVTLNWVYAEEGYVSIGYQVEDLKDDRRVAGRPAELQPILGFAYGEPTPREEEYLKKYGLGTDIVALTDERSTKFRMADNSGEFSAGTKPIEGPLENLVAFRPKEALKPGKDRDFRLQIPLYESAVVPFADLEGKQPPPEPFPGDPIVFNFDVPVHAVNVVDINKKATAKGVTLRLERVIDSPGRPQAVVCYLPPDDEHVWFINGGAGTLFGGWSTSGWSSTGRAWGNPPKKCHKLMLREPAEGRTSFEVGSLEGEPDCPYDEDFEACYEEIGYRMIRGPWKFEFRVPKGAGGDRPAREANY
jgi:hypothetical protein